MPIGTDTSRIIAEIIGCLIDKELVMQLKKENIDIKGYRFIDDCHFFFYSQADSEKGLKHFQRILGDLNLNINEKKTSINKAPFIFENNWNYKLNSFKISNEYRLQGKDLINYFTLLINLSKQFPNDSVIKYGIKKLNRIKVYKINWDLFESLVYSLTIAEGTILPDLLAVLLQNKKFINRKKLESIIKSLLNQHVYKGNHFEISWTLWIAKSFNIKIPNNVAQSILESRDIISILIIFDLKQNKLIPSNLILKDIEREFIQDGLTNEYWLLIYEASHKGWIKSSVLSTIKFFEEISKIGTSFYDNTKQISFGDPNVIPITPKTLINSRKVKADEKLSLYTY